MGLKKFFRKIKIKLIRKFITKKKRKKDFFNDPFIYD